MPERSARTETWHAGTPFIAGPVTLLPIEHVVVHSDLGHTHAWFSATKEPFALVVRDAEGLRAIGIDAMPVSLAALRERIPALDVVLASM